MKFSKDLGIDPQAFGVLDELNNLQLEIPDSISVSTFAWYNGRGRGIGCRTYDFRSGITLFVVWYEHRMSDHIEVVTWQSPASIPAMNPPTCNDMPEDAWNNAQHFPYQEYVGAAKHIAGQINEFMKRMGLVE